ncbi:Rho GTPase (Miro-like) [Legionella brunensis]|uniref:Rho GTPase (Miro-like) n=2 Tax=Legionella brunensis TaxID=29422 RepID=A0A0W0ST93_9GAMM|nr:Rho GTPase (Miro-like) [Legionella brunensis]
MKVVILGKKGAGKTQLLNRMLKNSFSEEIPPTVAAKFAKIDNELDIWDLSGDEQYENVRGFYYRQAEAAIYCIDLSSDEELNYWQIRSEIQRFRDFTNPDVPVVLVGTKADICSDNPEKNSEAAEEKIKAIIDEFQTEDISITDVFVTSSKENYNIEGFPEYLKALIQRITREREIAQVSFQPSQWQEAYTALRQRIALLPFDKYIAIDKELKALKTALEQPLLAEEKAAAVKTFIDQSHLILEGKHPNVLKSVLILASVATVTVIAGLIGFGIGFAAGIWSGPGAFFTGLMAGGTAASTVVATSSALGLLSGGLAAYSLFKPSKELVAIDDFVTQISESMSLNIPK